MGPYLTVPRKEKESQDGENAKVIFCDYFLIKRLIFDY